MGKRFLHNRAAVVTVAFVLLIALIGILAPLLAPHDPYVTDILDKFAPYSLEYPLGTDHLGRCVLSRLIYGIRPTLGLALLTMLGTIALGALLGVMAGYFRGVVEEIIMRVVDVMLSFQSDHGVRRGGPSGDQCPKCHHCQCVHQMGLVCPYDPNRRYAVPGPELCPVLPVRGDAGAVHPVPPPFAIHHL